MKGVLLDRVMDLVRAVNLEGSFGSAHSLPSCSVYKKAKECFTVKSFFVS